MDAREVINRLRVHRAIACVIAGIGLMLLAAPVSAQAPPAKLPLRVSYNLCRNWILNARTHPERTTEEQARQKCTELRARVMSPPTGVEQALPTAPLTAVEAEVWCTVARQHAWYFSDDVLKSVDNAQVQARCEQTQALIDPNLVVTPNSFRPQFLPNW